MTILTTKRLILEPFDDRHLDGLAALAADPEVMRYITGRPQSREETQAAIDRTKARWLAWGHSWWVFKATATGEIIGAGCIQYLDADPSQPREIGWRLGPAHWGRGYASEAARAMAAFAFIDLNSPELVAVADPANTASHRVMERLGMVRQPGLARHYDLDCVLYRITRAEWDQRSAGSDGQRAKAASPSAVR